MADEREVLVEMCIRDRRSEEDSAADFRLMLHQRKKQLKAASETPLLNRGLPFTVNWASSPVAASNCTEKSLYGLRVSDQELRVMTETCLKNWFLK